MLYKNLIDLQQAYYRVNNAMLWRNFKVFQAHTMICPELVVSFEGFGQCEVQRDSVFYHFLLLNHRKELIQSTRLNGGLKLNHV